MTPPAPAPSLVMHPGLSIGYGTVLARLEDEVVLGGGTHFLLARNGRGKTTLLRTLAGSHKPMAGSFHATGFTQYLPEDMRFDPEMPVKTLFRALLPAARREGALALAERIELDVRKPYGRLSTGNRRKTSLILAEYAGCLASGIWPSYDSDSLAPSEAFTPIEFEPWMALPPGPGSPANYDAVPENFDA